MDTVEAGPEMVRVEAAPEIALEGSAINQIAVQQLRTSGPAAETRFISPSFGMVVAQSELARSLVVSVGVTAGQSQPPVFSTFQVAELVRAEKISPF